MNSGRDQFQTSSHCWYEEKCFGAIYRWTIARLREWKFITQIGAKGQVFCSWILYSWPGVSSLSSTVCYMNISLGHAKWKKLKAFWKKSVFLYCQKAREEWSLPLQPPSSTCPYSGIFLDWGCRNMILINIVLGNAIQFDKDKRLRRLIHSALRYYKSCSEDILFENKTKN